MKRITTLLLLFFTFSCVDAQLVPHRRNAFRDVGGGGYTGDLLTETFNTASGAGPGGLGYDTTFTESAGSPDENYTGITSASGSGEMLQLDGSAATASTDHAVFADRDNVSGAILIYLADYPAADREIARFQLNGSQSGGSELRVDGDGDLRFIHGSTTIQPAGKLPTDTWIAVYFDYTLGTGANGAGTVEWATSATSYARPGSGNNFATSAIANGTAQVDQVRLTCQFSASGIVCVYDDFFLNTTPVTSNPWGL